MSETIERYSLILRHDWIVGGVPVPADSQKSMEVLLPSGDNITEDMLDNLFKLLKTQVRGLTAE